MQEDLLQQIQDSMGSFSKSQKLIANFILQSYEKAAYMTALKLGNAVNVSESTVVRFANELGFEGYPELQKNLQSLIKNRLTAVQRMNITNDRIGEGSVLKNTLTQDIDRIRRTMEEIDADKFDEAIEKICSARRIYILGVMSANILARFLDYNFQLIFDNIHFVQAINKSGIYQQIINMTDEDVFIALSFPRYSQSTISATAYAKECGANVVAITDSAASPLAAYADQLLVARSDMASFADSLVAPLSLLNAMIVALGAKKKDNIEQSFAKLEKLWEEHEVYKKDV
ncbi:MAG: MurR/RpiR family transcriptional regulator [Eubacterium sp.]|nr:MurR/RpiR family transcriptional regulator [Eubacterium sp.]